nr:unnamed protein product [Digitaria exilis]
MTNDKEGKRKRPRLSRLDVFRALVFEQRSRGVAVCPEWEEVLQFEQPTFTFVDPGFGGKLPVRISSERMRCSCSEERIRPRPDGRYGAAVDVCNRGGRVTYEIDTSSRSAQLAEN